MTHLPVRRLITATTSLLAAAAFTLAGPAQPTTAALPYQPGWANWPSGEAPCPEGQSRSATLQTQGYESGFPTQFNTGFTQVASSGSPEGGTFAQATSSAGAFTYLPQVQGTAGRATRLAFAAKATGASGLAVARVNNLSTTIAPTGAWQGVNVNVTPQLADDAGWLSSFFELKPNSGASLAVDNVQVFTCRTNATARIAGANRYEVAAGVAALYPAGPAVVYVASGANFPDALSGSALAGTQGVPLLLVEPNAVPSSIAAQLTRLNPGKIVILGGTNSVSAAVATSLGQYAPVERIAGPDRYAVSAGVSARFAPGPSTAFIATGQNFPDALSGGALAGSKKSPLLLTTPATLPASVQAELARLRPAHVVILGGPSSVSTAVETALAAYATGPAPKVERIGGANRYEVSAAAAARFGTPTQSFLASGLVFPDSLTGGALAGSRGAPLLITEPQTLTPAIRNRLTALTEARGTVLGGWASVPEIVRDQYGRTLP